MRTIAHMMLLGAAWLLWSGHYEPKMLLFGAASVVGVVALVRRMDLVDRESHPSHLGIRPLFYLPWLAKEIVLSNLHVARVILSPTPPIHPQILRVPASQKSELGQVLYANSITITPGTISLDVRDGQILVHALTDTTAEGVLSGEMDARVATLEGSS